MSFLKKLFGKPPEVPSPPDAATGPALVGGLSAPDTQPEAASGWYVTKPNVVLPTDDAPSQGGLYDFPGGYAQSFDGVDPGGESAAGGVTTHPDFAWLPTTKPQGAEYGGGSPPDILTEGEPPQEAGETSAAFSIGGTQIASFSELQGIASTVDEVDYIEPSDDAGILKQLPQDLAAPHLGSWAKAEGLDTTLEVPDYEAPDSSGKYAISNVSHSADETNDPPARQELVQERETDAQEGGLNDMTHRLPGKPDLEAPEENATLLDLSIESVQPRPIDPPPLQPDSETELGDLDDLL